MFLRERELGIDRRSHAIDIGHYLSLCTTDRVAAHTPDCRAFDARPVQRARAAVIVLPQQRRRRRRCARWASRRRRARSSGHYFLFPSTVPVRVQKLVELCHQTVNRDRVCVPQAHEGWQRPRRRRPFLFVLPSTVPVRVQIKIFLLVPAPCRYGCRKPAKTQPSLRAWKDRHEKDEPSGV